MPKVPAFLERFTTSTPYLLLPVLLVILPLDFRGEVQGGIKDKVRRVLGHVERKEVDIEAHHTVQDENWKGNS